ncbi:uncharacterized protein LOC130646063 [Hydractinia symbiolongicarpus]|uniref:uncharacterized protein LOC130646063 n=1 Tax=Hydractinia symbiolongicarpus TaxID=13093 RepID=UPI00254A25D9|nr:uncharacterized protein LOC130646063 [Hydractinia symbiolongicarpus]
MINFHANVNNLDSFAEQENDDVTDKISNINNHDTDEIRNELHEKIRTLNKTQRQIFEVVNDWVTTYVKGLACNAHHKIKPIHIFLTGSAGCGKSHLVTTISDMLNKALSYRAGNLEKDKILILAPTGVAAINIEGNTIHSALAFGTKRYCNRRNLDGFKQATQRLTEIFGCADDIPFAGISVIACGDFYQLPPIQARPVYAEYKDALLNLSHCWKHFKIAELTEHNIGRKNIESIDKIPENIPVQLVQNLNSRTQIETVGLVRNLLLKLQAKFMLTSNIDVSDKLING